MRILEWRNCCLSHPHFSLQSHLRPPISLSCLHAPKTNDRGPATQTTIRRSKHDELEVEVEDVLTRTADLVEDVAEDCMEDPLVQESLLRQDALLAAHNDSCPAEEEDLGVEAGGTSPEFVECLSDAIAEDVAKKEAEATFNIRVLRQVGDRARNYTCNDPSMETTKNTLREFAWLDAEEGKSYNTKVRILWGGAG